MNVNAMAKVRARTIPRSSNDASKPAWTAREKRALVRAVRRLKRECARPLKADDLRRVAIPGRTFAAVKSQAARLGLYRPTRRVQPWSDKERHMLVILGEKRHLGARGIKSRGFFTASENGKQPWRDRTVDSIAQKKRREGLVDPMRSLRARLATRLGPAEKRRLRKELTRNSRKKSTEEFAREYGIAPSTIRSYRKRWGIKHTWHDAMELPAARTKREKLAEATRARNAVLWKNRKEKLLRALQRERERRLRRAGGDDGKIAWRVCETCGRRWPAAKRFFAPSPKRRGGKVVTVYLRRTCRVCPRRRVR